MKRPILSLISALVLAAGLLFTTAAAASPQLVTSHTEAVSQEVSLTGISPDCQSLQVTLLLSKGVLLDCLLVPGGEHCEASWERQIPFFLNTLLYGIAE